MPRLWIDATYLKVRQNARIASVAVIVAVGVNTDGREVLGMDIGPSEAEPYSRPMPELVLAFSSYTTPWDTTGPSLPRTGRRSPTPTSAAATASTEGDTMLNHPTLDQLRALGTRVIGCSGMRSHDPRAMELLLQNA